MGSTGGKEAYSTGERVCSRLIRVPLRDSAVGNRIAFPVYISEYVLGLDCDFFGVKTSERCFIKREYSVSETLWIGFKTDEETSELLRGVRVVDIV